MSQNLLFYGDNLDVLRRHVKDESVSLVYADPPFNSNASYNVLFAAKDGHQSTAQIQAFDDTWTWNDDAARTFETTVERGGRVAEILVAYRKFMAGTDMLAYLTMMAPRLLELRRVLNESGSLYLHCDTTASHYLKLLLDAVFGTEHFQNEIIWQRTTGKALNSRRLPNNHDVLLVYSKSDTPKWNVDAAFEPYDEDNLDFKTSSKYSHKDPDGRLYRFDNLINPNANRPNLTYEFLGVTRVWRWTKDRMQQAYDDGIVIQSAPGRVPQMKRYLDEQRGRPFGDVWTDIPPLNSQAQERLGYPTQKPSRLLERILALGSDVGDVVLDPFCGCGTTIAAAQKLGRRWIGIDITHLAIGLIKNRLRDTYGDDVQYKTLGEPTTVEEAAELAATDKYQFQWWALGQVQARPVDQKKGADKGIDGRLYFHDGSIGSRQIILSVKGGHLKATDLRDLNGVITREKAEIGVLISFEKPTKQMRTEAASAGFYTSPWGKHAKLQLLTVEDLLNGATIDYPTTAGINQTFKQAPKAEKKAAAEVLGLFGEDAEPPQPKKKKSKR